MKKVRLFRIIHGLIQRWFSPGRGERQGFYLHIQIDKTFTIYLFACLAALRENHLSFFGLFFEIIDRTMDAILHQGFTEV